MIKKYIIIILILLLSSKIEAAITYIATGEQSETGSNVDSVVVSVPTGTESGDLMVAVIGCDGEVDFTEPSGWTYIMQISGAIEDNTPTLGVYYRIYQNGDASTFVWKATGAEAWFANIVSYRGTNQDYPIDAYTKYENTGATSVTTDPIYTSIDSCLIFIAFIADQEDSPYVSPTGWHESFNGTSNYSSAQGCGGAAADTLLTNNRGYINPGDFIQNDAEEYISISLGIRPEESGITRFGYDYYNAMSNFKIMINYMRASTEATYAPPDSMTPESIFAFVNFNCGAFLDDWNCKGAIYKRSTRALVCTTAATVIDNAAGLDWHGLAFVDSVSLSPDTAYDMVLWCDSCDHFEASANIYYDQPESPIYFELYEHKIGLGVFENPWTADSTVGNRLMIYIKGHTLTAASTAVPQPVFIGED